MGLARARGAHEEVIRIFERGLGAERGATHYVRAVIARSLVALGRLDDARRHFEVLAGGDFSGIPRNIRWTNTLAETAHLCADLGEEERAETLLDLLAPVSHHHGVLAVPVCYGGPIEFARGRLFALRGEGAEALVHLAEAAEAAEALGARPTRAWIALERGALLARRTELRRARESLEEARRLGEELGMPEVAAAAQERLAR